MLITTGLVSFVASTFNFYLDLNLTRNGLYLLQLWRLLTHHFLFRNSAELMVGLLVIYYFRVFERQMGTRIFVVWYVFISIIIRFTVQATLVTILLISTSLSIAILWADLMKFSFEGAYRYIFFLSFIP